MRLSDLKAGAYREIELSHHHHHPKIMDEADSESDGRKHVTEAN